MAESDVVRTATAVSEEVNINEVKVALLVDGLIPHTFGNKKKPKNGTADVNFTEDGKGFTMTATVRKSSGEETKWQFKVTQLPSTVVPNRSTWKVDKGKIIVNLYKAEEISWAPMLRSSGLEQAGSDDEKDD